MAADVLEQLEGLQRVADEIDRLDARRREATEQRDQVTENLSAAQAELGRSEEKAHAIDMERRKRELALKGERDHMARVKSRLGEVKTSREYQAVLTETSSAKQGIADHEEALAKDELELESITAEVDHLKAKVAGIEEDLAAAEGALAEVAGETDGTVAGHRAEESRLLEALPTAVVDRYRLIRSRRGGAGGGPGSGRGVHRVFYAYSAADVHRGDPPVEGVAVPQLPPNPGASPPDRGGGRGRVTVPHCARIRLRCVVRCVVCSGNWLGRAEGRAGSRFGLRAGEESPGSTGQGAG